MNKQCLFSIIVLIYIVFIGHCNAEQYYNVLRVVDGDTLIIDLNNNGKYDKKPLNESCRLVGISTTELNKMKVNLPESGSIAATNFLKGLIASFNNNVNITYDKTIKKTDTLNRQLVYVQLPNGICVNKRIIEAGFGIVYLKYHFDSVVKEKYIAITIEAHKNSVGLWSDNVIKSYWISELLKYGVKIEKNN